MAIRLRYVIPAILFLILYGIISLVIKLGVFKSVNVQTFDSPPILMLFKTHTGPYHKITPVLEEVEAFAKTQGLNCQSFGEYFDDPRVVEEIRLKSHGGCIVDSNAIEIKSLPEGFRQELRPATKYIKAEFDGSPAISPYKVYPKIQDFAFQSRLTLTPSIIEIYLPAADGKTGRTEYLWGLK